MQYLALTEDISDPVNAIWTIKLEKYYCSLLILSQYQHEPKGLPFEVWERLMINKTIYYM